MERDGMGLDGEGREGKIREGMGCLAYYET